VPARIGGERGGGRILFGEKAGNKKIKALQEHHSEGRHSIRQKSEINPFTMVTSSSQNLTN